MRNKELISNGTWAILILSELYTIQDYDMVSAIMLTLGTVSGILDIYSYYKGESK